MIVKNIKAENQNPFSLGDGVAFNLVGNGRGYIEYKGKHITGTLQGETLVADELEECGGCGGCHQPTFVGDCRQDDCRFPTWEWTEMFDED